MKRKMLIIGAMAAGAVLAGGWALAQSVAPMPSGFTPPFMHGQGPEGMGHGMMSGMGHMMNGTDHDMGHGMKGMGHGMMMKGMGPGMMHGRPGSAVADPAKLETLKTELGITAAQEPAWGKYAKSLQDAAAAMKATREAVDPAAVSKMTPADRFAFVTKMREQRQTQFSSIKAAADELVATLDATQKAKATTILPGLASGPGAMHDAFAGDQQPRH